MRGLKRTGKGYYREYFGAPKWFFKRMGEGCGNGSLLNVTGCTHYIGERMDGKRKKWYSGTFIRDFEFNLPHWKKEISRADFIIHFGRHL
jgi:hypothetical protein